MQPLLNFKTFSDWGAAAVATSVSFDSRVLSILQSKGLHAGPQYDGNSSPTCLHDSYSVFNPPLVDCSQEIRCPQVNVPAPSVTCVFQIVLVQVEHPQYETS